MTDEATHDTAMTGQLTRRNVVLGGVLACASGIAFAREPIVANPVVDEKRFEKWVPQSFDNWSIIASSGVVLPPPDSLSDRLYDNLITRVYAAPNMPPIMLLLAYNNAQDGVLQVHRPEVCYPVGGFALSETMPLDLTVAGRKVQANIFTATGPNRIEQVTYFTRLGNAFPRSWVEQRLAVMRANLSGDIPDGMMMRVSLLGLNQTQARPLLGDFAAKFIIGSDQRLQRLLLG